MEKNPDPYTSFLQFFFPDFNSENQCALIQPALWRAHFCQDLHLLGLCLYANLVQIIIWRY